MQTSLHILDGSPVPGDGRQDQIWRFVLDRVFADAVCTGVARLQVLLPDAVGADEISLRMRTAEGLPGESTAVAWLVRQTPLDVRADKLYWLRSQTGGPSFNPTPGSGWTLVERWGFAPWSTRVLGGLLRLFRWMRRPDWEDRMAFALKARWVTRPMTGACRLEVWVRSQTPSKPTTPL
jgi:hypothetical protein